MISRRRSPVDGDESGSPQKETEPTAQLGYQRPKVFVVDLGREDVEEIAAGGFNVTTGTFGRPTSVPAQPGHVRHLRPSAKLAGYTEQEVIVVDLASPDPVPGQVDNASPPREPSAWVKLDTGTIDPRPRAMIAVRDALDRIYAHGGIFILLAEHRWDPGYVSASPSYGEIEVHHDLPWDCWSLLSVLDRVGTKFDHGEELQVASSEASEAFRLPRQLKDARFTCTLNPESSLRERWITLATSKYGDPVAGVIVPDGEEEKGWVIIVPRLAQPGEYVRELLEDVLPVFAPRLFPRAEGTGWTRREEYELPTVLHINREILEVEQDARRKVTELQERIEHERSEHGYLHDLLTATDAELVAAVIRTLEVLGFTDVRDVDEGKNEEGDGHLREDIQVWDRFPTLLVEVKGITGLPKESATLQAHKYVVPRMREWGRTDVQALSIINQQRGLPALEREHKQVFQDDVLANAEEQGFGLLTTWDLFRLARGKLANGWTWEQISPLLYRTGRIAPIPEHYRFAGEIENYWEQAGALALQLGEQAVHVGDTIVYELLVDFVEEQIDSLQLDGQDVQDAPPGSLVGIKTTLTKAQGRKGTRAYLLTDDATGSESQGRGSAGPHAAAS
jgi:hypothetical protein